MGKGLIKDPAGLGSTEIAAALRESLVICVIRDAVELIKKYRRLWKAEEKSLDNQTF